DHGRADQTRRVRRHEHRVSMRRRGGGGHRGGGLVNSVTSCPNRATRSTTEPTRVKDGTDPEKTSETLSSHDQLISGIRSMLIRSRSLEPSPVGPALACRESASAQGRPYRAADSESLPPRSHGPHGNAHIDAPRRLRCVRNPFSSEKTGF